MKRIIRTLCFCPAVVILAAATPSHAAVPQLINYQGRLTNAAGWAVAEGNDLIKFVIYDAAPGASASISVESQYIITMFFPIAYGTVAPSLTGSTEPEIRPNTNSSEKSQGDK